MGLPAPGRAQSGDDIAIVGMACRFAASPDLASYWQNLRDGRDCITRGPEPVVRQVEGSDDLEVAAWGVMPDRTAFDAPLMGYRPDARDVDPQHGALYEAFWGAVEDAGIKISDIGPSTAVYAGCARIKSVARAAFDDVVNSDATFAATHFSYFQNLQRESIMIDSMCATSTVAIHLACQSLRLHASDYALAGAVAIDEDSDGSYVRTPRSIFSTTGYCRPFDRRSSGTVPGDGVGAVLLRRLTDAVRDGDPVYAVIRSTAVDNDGRAKAGFTIPGVQGKIDVIRHALTAAGLTGEDLGFIEGHGVGIPLNDEIEATALREALGSSGPPVAVGSVKASVGHCDTAAGMAAVIKAALAVHSGYLPATPNTGEPIEELGGSDSRFQLLPEGRPWKEVGRPRRAGVMSAGIGGTNAFAILEEFAEPA